MTSRMLVAIVDDDESVRETTKDLLESAGFAAATFASAEAFLASGRLADVACLLVDQRMPGMSGVALHEHLVAAGHPLPAILMTAYPDERLRARAFASGVVACLIKPFSDDELLGCIACAGCSAPDS